MLRLPLEDDFSDIIKKARFGLGRNASDIALQSQLSPDRLAQLEGGHGRPLQTEVELLAKALNLEPTALWAIVQGWGPEPIALAPYISETLCFPPMQSNGYVIRGPGIVGALVVDPGGSPEKLISMCEALGGLCAVVVTHTHHDHVDALPQLIKRFPNAPVLVHADGVDRLGCQPNVLAITGESQVAVHGVTFDVLQAPGHSDDGLVIRLNNIAFVGDTLFAGSLGRSGQGPATYDTLLHSARRLLTLPDETRLLPGHGPVTTVALERVHNPFLAGDAL